MNKEIVIGFFKEHDRECRYEAISRHIKERRACTFCLDINRDTSLLMTRMEGARKTIDVGLALSPGSEISHYLPYETAGFKLFFQRGNGESEHILNVMKEVFAMLYERVIILAHSIPTLPVTYIEQAIAHLRNGEELIIGPLENGMFYLVGLTRRMFERILVLDTPPMFGFIDDLLRETSVRTLREHTLHPHLLPKWYIVKSLEDLKKVSSDRSLDKGWKARWIGQTISDLHGHLR